MQDKHNVVDHSKALPITIRSLTKKYGSLYALDSIDLDVSSGEFLTLLGPSGSGKTTLLMAIAGFNRPDSGSIQFGDTEMILAPPHKREVGMVFQNYALFPHMTVAENIGFPLKLRRVASKECRQRVDEALSTVQLSDLGDRRIDQLSGDKSRELLLLELSYSGQGFCLWMNPYLHWIKNFVNRCRLNSSNFIENLVLPRFM